MIFCGAILQNGLGSEKIETYVVIPPEPVHIYLYRCDSRFHTEHLQEFLKERDNYGILVLDANTATFAFLEGRRLELVREITSGIPGKHRAGGQSAARFQRLREAQMLDYFKRVGRHANEIFLENPDLKGIMLGGPGPTKQDFQKGDFLQYTLKEKIIATRDTAYVGEQGVKEVVEHAPEIMRTVRYFEERRIVQDFLYEIGHDSGLATYGESDVRNSLEAGAVKTLLLSESLDVVNVVVRCTVCDYVKQDIVDLQNLTTFEKTISEQQCPTCSGSSFYLDEVTPLIDVLAELAEQSGSDIEIISAETEEGVMLKDAFGGIAAILRFKLRG